MIKTKALRKHYRHWSYKRDKTIPIYWVSPKTVTDEQLNEFFDYCLHWCQKKFGKKKGKPLPHIEWEWKNRWYQQKNILALYDKEENVVEMRIQGHRTIYNLAETIIHEYIHYLQSTHGNWYERYDKKHGYSKNPYEVEAYHLGGTYCVDCTKAVLRWMEG